MGTGKKTVKFKYHFDEDYNPVYINGAQGGINPNGEIIANFYLERFPLPYKQEQEINENGSFGNVISSEPADLDKSMLRFVKTGVIMNLQTAKSIHKWLGQHIDILEKIQKNSIKQ